MTNQTLVDIKNTICDSKEEMETTLFSNKLIIKSDKNQFWIYLNAIGVVCAILLIFAFDRGKYNLEIGLVFLWISIYGLWRMQQINKTVTIDLFLKTISIVPNSIIQRFICRLLKIDTTYKFDSLPDFRLLFYMRLKYDWTRRIYFKKGFLTVHLFEFKNKEAAHKILRLLKG